MPDVLEEPLVQRAVDAAYRRWLRTDEAWEAVTWALARDPSGRPLSESGLVRAFVSDRAQSIGLPTVWAGYDVEPTVVIVEVAVFEDSIYMYAGRA